MTIGVLLQERVFIVGDGVSNSITLTLGIFPLQNVPKNPVILSTSTVDPSTFSANLTVDGKQIILSTVSGSPFRASDDTAINVVLDVS